MDFEMIFGIALAMAAAAPPAALLAKLDSLTESPKNKRYRSLCAITMVFMIAVKLLSVIAVLYIIVDYSLMGKVAVPYAGILMSLLIGIGAFWGLYCLLLKVLELIKRKSRPVPGNQSVES